MRGMVKLNDLEDMAEPPLNGNIKTSLGNQRHQGGNGMEIEAGSGMGAQALVPSAWKTYPGLEQAAPV